RKSEKEARSYDAVFKKAEMSSKKKKSAVAEDLFGDDGDDDSDDAVPTRHADDFADFF
ncbi:hypothetical protein EC988_007662, partial [Linderina pennispora]